MTADRQWTMSEQDDVLTAALERDGARLRNFIRKQVSDTAEAEDILQDVFYELVQTYRLLKPVEQVTAWMFRVARNRIIDVFRKKKTESLSEPVGGEDGLSLEELLPSPQDGPDALYARSVLTDAIEEALGELPPEQREVFVAHELEGESFKEMAARTGINQNTLLARKRYAVLHLRKRLRQMRESFSGEGVEA
ncbi:RNA polymerase sigma factor [Granulicella cerasi]|uniref:RNA polymerase sigma factor n=1 Tax=Granulicella cerasi TaxID=741063 RepID=A0ABW1Z3Q0_9BACT|nr:sigma-70 family RNA polymerase sigma factor [Granulicella cerasi]